VEKAAEALARTRSRVERARERLDEIGDLLARITELRLIAVRRELIAIASRAARPPVQRLKRARADCSSLSRRIADAAVARLRAAQLAVKSTARLCDQLAPDRLLRRGFSITLDSRGRAIRSIGSVKSGDEVSTRVADGAISSQVLATRGRAQSNQSAQLGAGEDRREDVLSE
jgi:exodeoxyribonuclease VII large subunit